MSYIEINNNKCKSCYLCVDVCPKKLIRKSDFIGKAGQFAVEFCDPNSECLGCAQCALVCPDIAIENVYRQ